MIQNSHPKSTTAKFAAIAANFVLVFHTLFAGYAVLGAPLVLYDLRFLITHVPVVLWSSMVNLANWTCPLTPLEQNLRRLAGQQAFQGGWIQHYLEPVVRPLGMPRRMELIAGFSVLLWNLIVYLLLWRWI